MKHLNPTHFRGPPCRTTMQSMEPMPIFFKKLPDDVHEIVAKHLFSTVECESDCYEHSVRDNNFLETLLLYAKDSPAQHSAVMKAMSFTLAPSSWTNQTILDWLSTSASELLELNLMSAPRAITFPGRLPRFPKLRKVSTYAAPDMLSLIQGSPNLSELTVDIIHNGYWGDLVSTIRSLPLKTLDIYIGYELLCLPRRELMRLRAACPTVEHLNSRNTLYLRPALWKMITGMRSLKRIGLHHDIDDGHLPFLQTMSEIEFTNMASTGLQRIQRLNTRVAGLFKLSMVHWEDIRGFTSFPNLRRLSVTPVQGEEGALVGAIDNLEELSLSWHCSSFLPVRRYRNGVLGLSATYPAYYTPDGEVLENIIRRTPKLRSLKISDAIVKAEVVEKLLEVAGNKLENFEISFDWQKEAAVPRIERILKAVARCCANLRTLRFLEQWFMNDTPIVATREQTKNCLKTLRDITEGAPNFLSYRNIRHIIQTRFTESLPQNRIVWDDIVRRF